MPCLMASTKARKEVLDAILGDRPLPAGRGERDARCGRSKASAAAPLEHAGPGKGRSGKGGQPKGGKEAGRGAEAQARAPRFGTLCLLPVPRPALPAQLLAQCALADAEERSPRRRASVQPPRAPGSPASPTSPGSMKRPAPAGAAVAVTADDRDARCASSARHVDAGAASPAKRAALAPAALLMRAAPAERAAGSAVGCLEPALGCHHPAPDQRSGQLHAAPVAQVSIPLAGGVEPGVVGRRSLYVDPAAACAVQPDSTSPTADTPLPRTASDASMHTCTPGTPAGGAAEPGCAASARRTRSLLAPGSTPGTRSNEGAIGLYIFICSLG